MARRKSYAVIGLGQFGNAIVQELVENGADVIAIDKNEPKVKKIGEILNTAFVADATKEETLQELGIKDVDAAIVAYGANINGTILTTVLLKELGVKHIIVRTDDDYFIPIIKKLGATEVISPQKAAGIALANRLGSYDYKDFYKLDSKYSVVSIVVNEQFVPITLMELSSKDKYGVNILLIKRTSGTSFVPGGKDKIIPGDTIFVVGTTKEIRAFSLGINGKIK